jgi:error-prone DNA polymerase
MIAEYRMLRFSAELHPLTLLQRSLPSGTVSSDRLPHLRQGSSVCVAGLVTTRQRPQTAKGYVFVLMEDEHGPVNVIVKPDVYQRDRSAVRMEPFLIVRGKLQKDGATLNVIAERVEALRVPGAPVRRSGLARTYAESRDHRAVAAVREGSDSSERFSALQTSLPDTMEYWADPGDDGHPDRPDPGAFRYLTALRQSPPGIKSFG